MKKLFFISLIFMCFQLHAGIESLAGTETTFKSLCLNNNTWQTCPNAQNAPAAKYETTYRDVFVLPATQESIAFGYFYDSSAQGLTVQCRAKGSATWKNCTPSASTIPAARYYGYSMYNQVAHDGDGSFMLIGVADDNSSLIAACRAPNGTWSDCSPTVDTQKFYPSAVTYGNGQWMVIGSFARYQGSYSYFPGLCMDPNTLVWSDCRTNIEDRSHLIYTEGHEMKGLAFINNQWVATGRGKYNFDAGLYDFRSYCRKTSETLWTDCSNISVQVRVNGRLVKDNNAGLLLINEVNETDFEPTYSSQILCRTPNGAWQDCTGSLKQLDHIYTDAVVGADGNWILIGNHHDQYMKYVNRNLNYLTATQTGGDWTVVKQTPASKEWQMFAISAYFPSQSTTN